MAPIHLKVEDEHGVRLDLWLSRRMEGRARNQIQQDIEAGRVLVNGLAQPTKFKVNIGDTIAYEVPEAVSSVLLAEEIPLTIIFEDEHMLVIDKPAGLVVHPAPGHESGTLANALLAHCGPSLEGVGGEGRWGIVHRLDAGTSGLMLAAKTPQAHAALTEALAERRVRRQYLGLCVGTMRENFGTVDRPIGRRPGDRKLMGITREGREARTDWKVLLQQHGLTLLALTLHTGRTHQIRVHLQALGRPILADEQYGWTKPRTMTAVGAEIRTALRRDWPMRPALHAAKLTLKHPIESERELAYVSRPPADLATILDTVFSDAWPQTVGRWLAEKK